MIKNLRRNLQPKNKPILIKVNTNEHIRLTLLVGFLAFTSGVIFLNFSSIDDFLKTLNWDYRRAFDRDYILRDTFFKLYDHLPNDEEFKLFYETRPPRDYSKVIGRRIAFTFFYISPVIMLLLFFCYPRNQPIVCDRERRVIYTVSFNRLYIFQLQNLDKRYYTPITFLKMDNKIGVFQPVDGALHDSLHVNLQRADKPDVIKTFRCGSIPVVDAYFGKVIRDFVADYFYGDLDEKDLYQSKNSFSILDPIRWFFDYPLCYYRDRTRDKKILARVDQYIADNPKPFISDGTPSKEQVVAEHKTKKGNYHRYYNGLVPDYD